jgi:hypothetical protein
MAMFIVWKQQSVFEPVCITKVSNTPLGKLFSCIAFVYAHKIQYDAPPSSLMDSIVNPKVKTTEGKKVGARSLPRDTLRVKGRVKAPRWD